MNKRQALRDKVETFHNALIQHGQLSDRIYLMKLNTTDPALLIVELDSLARCNGYTKIFVKVPVCQADAFLKTGYEREATIPGFYHGHEAAVFLGRYLGLERQTETVRNDYEHIREVAQSTVRQTVRPKDLSEGATMRRCTEDDAPEISDLYRTVFASYPFPIDDPGYIRETMRDNVVYYGIKMDGRLVALSSAEMDTKSENVEMTDFATLPEYRGNGFAMQLLMRMEQDMFERGIRTAYTIARAISPGMNITFAKCGYSYGGRLKNNTNIAGTIESMNVWYKTLS